MRQFLILYVVSFVLAAVTTLDLFIEELIGMKYHLQAFLFIFDMKI